jgi:hypothetical protein
MIHARIITSYLNFIQFSDQTEKVQVRRGGGVLIAVNPKFCGFKHSTEEKNGLHKG